MRGGVVVLAVLASACGRVGFDATGDGGTSDGSTADVAADSSPFICGDLVQMTDDFTDGILNPAKWTRVEDPGTTTGETAGVARITLASANPMFRYGHLKSTCTYDGRGRSIAIRIAATPTVSPSADMAFCMTHLDTLARQVCLDFNNGQLVALFNNGSGATALMSRAFSATTDRYWRLRQFADTVVWETSGDAVSWVPLHSAASPTDLSTIIVELYAGTFGSVTNPGLAEYDDLMVQ